MKQKLIKLTGILLAAALVFAMPAAVRASVCPSPSAEDGNHYPLTSPPLNTIEPTCTEDGSYEIITWCMWCSEILSKETVTIPATGHSWYVAAATPATCTTDGVITYICSTCGAAYYETIPATGHTLGIMPAREATCEEEALTEGYYCSTCGEILLYQYSSPALGHDWDEGVVQGDEESLLQDHDIVYTCSRCGKTRVETVKANGRSFFLKLYNKPPHDGTDDTGSMLEITKQPEDLEIEWQEGNMGTLTIEASGGVEPFTYRWIVVPDVLKDSMLDRSFVDQMKVIGSDLADGLDLAESFGKAEGGYTGSASAKPAVIGSFTEIGPGKTGNGDGSEDTGKALNYELIPSTARITETDAPEFQVEVGSESGYTAWCIVYDDYGDNAVSEKVQIIPAPAIENQQQEINNDDTEAVSSVSAADENAGKPEAVEVSSAGYELVGQWYCSHDGVPVCLDLKDEGAYTLTIAQSETEGTWELTDEGVVLDGKADAAMIIINNEGIMWAGAGEVFTSEEVKAWEPAPSATENIEMSSFDGYWVSAYVESEGKRLPSNVAGDNSELIIEGGRAAMGGSLFGDVICDFAFEDGELSYENSAARVVLQLLEDDTLRCTVTGEDSELIIYMMPGNIKDLPFFISQESEE